MPRSIFNRWYDLWLDNVIDTLVDQSPKQALADRRCT